LHQAPAKQFSAMIASTNLITFRQQEDTVLFVHPIQIFNRNSHPLVASPVWLMVLQILTIWFAPIAAMAML
jgi:hypothetical protein